MIPSHSSSIPLLLATFLSTTNAVNNGLSRTPAMGWNNWNSLGCDVSESLLLDSARNMVNLGLRDVGYEYIVLDDCWSDGRDPTTGKIQVDLSRFPHGMKWVAEQIHNHNLKYGMYSSAGELTCARYAGSLDYETQDAESWASWDVDYLKYDNCYSMGRLGPEATFKRYDTMARALNSTGRSILYSLCNWGEDFVNSWGVSIANSWRISGDIYDSFARPHALCSCTDIDPSAPNCVAPGSHCSVLTILNRVAPYVDRGQPGGWQDLDMLEVGQGGMTDEEYKAHYALWSAVKSPLLIGADIRDLSADALTILNNPAIIALNQDPLGIPARRILRDTDVKKDRFGIGETQVWTGPLYGGDQAVIFLNAAPQKVKMTAYLEDIFLDDGPGGSAPQCSEDWDVYDLWAGRMKKADAQTIVDAMAVQGEEGSVVEKLYRDLNWFNSTSTSYKEALIARDERLMGEKVSSVKAQGSMVHDVPSHSALVFRLRSKSGKATKRYMVSKDEL